MKGATILAAGLLSVVLVRPAGAQLSDAEIAPFGPSTKGEPAPAVVPKLNRGGSLDGTPGVASYLDKPYDDYLAFKKDISDRYNLDVSMVASTFTQSGTPNGGKPVWLLVYYPSATWKPFTDTPIGSGQLEVTIGSQQYWSSANTASQTSHMGLITFPNDWLSDSFSWSTVAYTHTFPGVMKWLSVTVGQYDLSDFDPNSYAGNAQVNFIGYAFAQDATQTFPSNGLGAYATARTPDGQFALSSGFQDATNLLGRGISTAGFRTGKYTYWGNFQWTPTIAGLGPGIYSVLYYQQPAVPQLPTRSNGISFSASQEIGGKWGAYVRVSNASGANTPITTSVAFGGIRNDPFGRNPTDQAGLAFAWNKTNFTASGVTAAAARRSELVAEIYYAYTVFKGLHITPDLQLFFHPALAPRTAVGAVFTICSTTFF